MEGIEIVDTNADNILEYGVCGYKNINRAGYLEKIAFRGSETQIIVISE